MKGAAASDVKVEGIPEKRAIRLCRIRTRRILSEEEKATLHARLNFQKPPENPPIETRCKANPDGGYVGSPHFKRKAKSLFFGDILRVKDLMIGEELNRGSRPATEKHYRVKELAKLWGFSATTIACLFCNEPDVLRLSGNGGKRAYVTLSIPESVVLRVHQRLGNQPLEAKTARRRPLRVVHLRNGRARVPKQTRDIVKLHSREQAADSKGVAESMGSAVRYPGAAATSAGKRST